jgi:hypothetical protein
LKKVRPAGTITDVNGEFTLNASGRAALQASYTGYASKEISAGSRTRLSIILEKDTRLLEEAAAVGYGVQTAGQTELRPIVSREQFVELAGYVTGVQARQALSPACSIQGS